MKIKSICLKGFRAFSEVSIEDLHPHLNLLIGVNGSGKSSVLDATALLLTAFTARLTTVNSKGAQIALSDIRIDSKGDCSLQLRLDSGVEWMKFKSRRLDKSEESDFSHLNEYTAQLREKLDDREEISLPIIVHYGVKRSVTEIPLKFPKTDNTLPTAAYKDWIDSRASYRDIFPWLRGEEDYENELIRDDPNAKEPSMEALREAMRRIFPEYTDMRVRRKPHLEVVLKKNNQELGLSQLSDGEKCYIALVCDIVRRLSIANNGKNILNGEGIVLIDEVDLHLHPSWEQTVMQKLHSTFPNIQFIVSAHSPLVASNFNGKVYAIDKGEVVTLPRIFGLDFSTVLNDWMGTSSENREINSLVELHNAYSDNNMSAQATAVKKRIMEILDGDTNAEILRNLH